MAADGDPLDVIPADTPVPVLTVLSHPTLSRIGDRVFLGELLHGHEALLSRHVPPFAAPRTQTGAGKPLGDPFLSRRPLRFTPLPDGGVALHRDASPTPVAVGGGLLEEHQSFSAALLDHGVVLELAGRIVLLLHRRPPPEPDPAPVAGLLGESAEIEALRRAIARAAPRPAPVWLHGAAGTGKELAARSLHAQSPRAGGPFVTASLEEAAPDLSGPLGHAVGGTLFLSAVGEASPAAQKALLQVLESRAPERGDVRVIAAGAADLEAALRDRLGGLTLRLPPLRNRREDLGRLLLHFLGVELAALGAEIPKDRFGAAPWIPPAMMIQLALCDWPGNVRQLRHVARQLAAEGCGEDVLSPGDWINDLLPPTAQVGEG